MGFLWDDSLWYDKISLKSRANVLTTKKSKFLNVLTVCPWNIAKNRDESAEQNAELKYNICNTTQVGVY